MKRTSGDLSLQESRVWKNWNIFEKQLLVQGLELVLSTNSNPMDTWPHCNMGMVGKEGY